MHSMLPSMPSTTFPFGNALYPGSSWFSLNGAEALRLEAPTSPTVLMRSPQKGNFIPDPCRASSLTPPQEPLPMGMGAAGNQDFEKAHHEWIRLAQVHPAALASITTPNCAASAQPHPCLSSVGPDWAPGYISWHFCMTTSIFDVFI